jgi:hypothetical protein
VIKELREKRAMTQTDLAKKAKVSQGYIAKVEPSARPGQPKGSAPKQSLGRHPPAPRQGPRCAGDGTAGMNMPMRTEGEYT